MLSEPRRRASDASSSSSSSSSQLPQRGPATLRCTLRAAIAYANGVPRGATITLRLAAGVFAVHAEPLPLITRDLTIIGSEVQIAM